jgi:hypothetical protein
MNVTTSEKNALGFAAAQRAIAPIQLTAKKRLVARWLVDRNSKIYCQWVGNLPPTRLSAEVGTALNTATQVRPRDGLRQRRPRLGFQ